MIGSSESCALLKHPGDVVRRCAVPESGEVRTHAKSRPRVPDLAGRISEVALSYQRALQINPQQPEALVGISLVALASRQIDSAVKMAIAAVAAAPNLGTAWAALGEAAKAAARWAEAEHAFSEAIRLDGMDALAHVGMGELELATGCAEEAMREFELALMRRPTLMAAHLGLGNALALTGRNAEALERYDLALALRPRLAEVEFAAGFVLTRLGRGKEAETRYRRALMLRPDFAAAWINLGNLLREQGRAFYAEAALRRAVELRPDLISGWINLALLDRDLHRADSAEAHLRRAFALNPNQVETLVAWCQFRVAEQDLGGAWEWMRWALVRNPDCDEAVNMHGILLHMEGRFADAVAMFDRAEMLGSGSAASNRGNSLLDLGRMGEALESHKRAVADDPANAGAEYNLALTQLRLGDWQHGWTGYEARWRFREVHRAPRIFAQPRWRGEDLQGKRILLHAEQGLGDTIQFCRYAALVVGRGGVPILQVQAGAERLMRSLSIVHGGIAETGVLGAPPPEFDLECPLLSLPAIFGTTVERVPWAGAYLGAEQETAAERLLRTIRTRRGLRVGIAWAGNPRYKADRARSMKLEMLVPLLRAVDASWISLQKGEAAKQLAHLPKGIQVDDGSSDDRDLADTAAQIACLDLVITTDTCIAHLAGAMGKPVWILLPHLADWRWMEERETTPWYPTARLFRQSSPGDWDGVLNRVVAEMKRSG